MHRTLAFSLTFGLALGAGLASTAHAATASATIESKSGSTVTGTATFTEVAGGIELTVSVQGAIEGLHGVHIHETGDCSAPDAMSAGGHWNPEMVDHGDFGAMPSHLGDLGNMTVAADGTGTLERTSMRWTLGDQSMTDVAGKALIVHELEDDFQQPAGNAGARHGCGVIALDMTPTGDGGMGGGDYGSAPGLCSVAAGHPGSTSAAGLLLAGLALLVLRRRR